MLTEKQATTAEVHRTGLNYGAFMRSTTGKPVCVAAFLLRCEAEAYVDRSMTGLEVALVWDKPVHG